MRSALILAGGASSRFGRAKPFEILQGKPIVRWVADAVSPLAEELLVSIDDSASRGRYAAILPEARFVFDRVRGRGPIEGMTRGFEAALGKVIIVAPCDAPLLRRAFVELLLEHLSGFEGAVPRRTRFDPVRAVYDREAVLREIHRNPSIGSPSSLVDHLRASFVDAEILRRADPHLVSFIDVNRASDFARAEQVLRTQASV